MEEGLLEMPIIEEPENNTLSGTEITPAHPGQGSFMDEPSDQLRKWAGKAFEQAGANQLDDEEPHDLDVSALLKAAAGFVREQQIFMTAPNAISEQERFQRLARFSRAQGVYIDALQNTLHELDVL
jgi:hypothetical protein